MLRLGSPPHSLQATCSVTGTVLICIKGSSLNIQFSLLRAISGSRDTACDWAWCKVPGINSMSVSKQCRMEIGGQIPQVSFSVGKFWGVLNTVSSNGIEPYCLQQICSWTTPVVGAFLSLSHFLTHHCASWHHLSGHLVEPTFFHFPKANLRICFGEMQLR